MTGQLTYLCSLKNVRTIDPIGFILCVRTIQTYKDLAKINLSKKVLPTDGHIYTLF